MPDVNESAFYSNVRVFLDELMHDSPSLATALGEHRHDDRLADFSREAIQDQRKKLGSWLAQFQAAQTGGWSMDARIDLTLTIQTIKSLIRQIDRLRIVFRDPGFAANECLGGVHLLIIRAFAPLPQRMKSVLGRLRGIPKALADGRALIKAPEVPPVWADIALETSRQGIGLFSSLVPSLAENVPELKLEILAAAQAAAAAMKEYAEWIQNVVIPQAKGDFTAGKTLFDEILHEDHMVGYDSDSLLKTGWKLFDDTERQIRELAVRMDPGKTAKQILDESKKLHPSAGELLDAYRRAMSEARKFVVERGIATIPAGESIRVEPTPAFQRPLLPYAAYMIPGFFEPAQEGIFWVTPVEEGADEQAAERKLRGHPLADIPVTALHEAYPGHHLQLVAANRVKSIPRMFGTLLSTLFIEGWAFYCEELMEELGYINQPIQKLARLQAQLWRAARIIIDVSLHTRGMTVDEAIRFLVEKAWLEPDDATAEVRRYTQSPTQPQSYLMGKLQILEITAEYKKRNPSAGMRQMHDAILGCGSLPPRLMRQKLFGEGVTAGAGGVGRAGGAVAESGALKKAAARKTAPKKKPEARKAAPKKTAARKPAPKKKTAARRPALKKATARKTEPKKTVARRASLKKKAAVRKTAPKKIAAARKQAPKKKARRSARK